MGEQMSAVARLDEGMRFDAKAGSGHRILLDAATRKGGTDAGFLPMELLLVGLAGCTAMDVISILRKMRQDVTDYEVRVHGERAETHPMVFEDITVEHVVTGHDVDPAAVQRAVELSETRYCGAGAMLGKTARLTHRYRVIQARAATNATTSQAM
jgi:putative redox protein